MKKLMVMAVVSGMALSQAAVALDKSDFNGYEFAFRTAEPKGLSATPRMLNGTRQDLYNFVAFESVYPKEKRVAFLDTADRALKNANLIIRVREDITKPWKSKITVKLRTPNLENSPELSKYKKAEIDVGGGREKYSVSYDINYFPSEIDVRAIDVAEVLAAIESGNAEAWSLVAPLAGHFSDLQQTEVFRMLQWSGPQTLVNGTTEVDYTVWSPYYKQSDVYASEISFKGHAVEKAKLENIASQVSEVLKAGDVFVNIPDSKTEMVFSMSEGFN